MLLRASRIFCAQLQRKAPHWRAGGRGRARAIKLPLALSDSWRRARALHSVAPRSLARSWYALHGRIKVLRNRCFSQDFARDSPNPSRWLSNFQHSEWRSIVPPLQLRFPSPVPCLYFTHPVRPTHARKQGQSTINVGDTFLINGSRMHAGPCSDAGGPFGGITARCHSAPLHLSLLSLAPPARPPAAAVSQHVRGDAETGCCHRSLARIEIVNAVDGLVKWGNTEIAGIIKNHQTANSSCVKSYFIRIVWRAYSQWDNRHAHGAFKYTGARL